MQRCFANFGMSDEFPTLFFKKGSCRLPRQPSNRLKLKFGSPMNKVMARWWIALNPAL
ncbi:Uncharacterised protein [Vibrio cholerae]|nr:Uncharacterised protein [Vibrio cholerae]